MIKIIDSTLAMLDNYLPKKEQLLQFCSYMKEIGIIDLELSKYAYKIMGNLPSGYRFYLRIETYEKKSEYPGIYRYFMPQSDAEEKTICEFQMNDVKEIVHLRSKKGSGYIRIVGLDDLLCRDYALTIKEIQKIFRGGTVNFCPENACHCATALAVEWFLAGGNEVTTSFASCGQRAATEEVYIAMNIVKRFKPNQSLRILVQVRKLFEEIIGAKLPLFKPVVGKQIFYVESGIHVDGILKNPSNYEAYPPEKVGQKTEIVLGKYSGRSSVMNKCQNLSLKLPGKTGVLVLLECVKELSVRKGSSITDEEFLVLYKEVTALE